MNIKLIWLICILFLLFSACNSAMENPSLTPIPDSSATPGPTSTVSAKSKPSSLPSNTPTPTLAETVTPPGLEVISFQSLFELTLTDVPTQEQRLVTTPFPTFDVRQAKRQTPFPPAQCPAENPGYQIKLDKLNDYLQNNYNPWQEDDIAWGIINQSLIEGASFDQVITAFKNIGWNDYFQKIDLTGDGVPELVVFQKSELSVIGCDHGKFKTLLIYSNTSSLDPGLSITPHIESVKDMNLDGIPDVVLSYMTEGYSTAVDILEWQGDQFKSLFDYSKGVYSVYQSIPIIDCGEKVAVQDLNHDGTLSLVLTDKTPCLTNNYHGHMRGTKTIFRWDSSHFVFSSRDYDPPVYRFEALQDADRYFFVGEYDKALKLYQDAIYSNKLLWWTRDLLMYMTDSESTFPGDTTLKLPTRSDPNEYPMLAAYARYRIELLLLAEDRESDAETIYQTMVRKIPEDSSEHYNVDMAEILIKNYQRTHDLAKACLPVVLYIQDHYGDIFYGYSGNDTLSSFIHGIQSIRYNPQDLCPFVLPSSLLNPTAEEPKITLTNQVPGIGTSQISEKDGMVMQYIPDGDFPMGSDKGQNNEKPIHTVFLDAFWIDRTEVTNALYQKCIEAGVCQPSYLSNISDFSSDIQPVVGVNWDQANTYCAWAGRRLPTEAEWEKAARGTDGRTYPWGEGMNAENEENGFYSSGVVESHPKGISPYGVFDMSGNAWEWVSDWYGKDYYSKSLENNPTGPDSGIFKVIRGGGWDSTVDQLRSAFRGSSDPTSQTKTIGFRCVKSAKGQP